MASCAIVEDLNVFKDVLAGLFAGGIVLAGDRLDLEGGPKAFHHGIVVAIAGAAHGAGNAACFQELAVFSTGVLHAAIAVVHEAILRTHPSQGHVQSVEHQLHTHVVGHGPAHDPPCP